VRRFSSLAWRSLLARRLRSVLTIAGVGLGVAVLFASLTASATMDAAVDRAAADEMGHADLRVQTLEERGLSPEAVAAVKGVAGVAVAAPALERKTYLAADPNQTASSALPAPVTVLGIDPSVESQVHDMPLSAGRRLDDTDSLSAVVTQTLAAEQHLRIGDSITVNGSVKSGPQAFSVVGIVVGDGALPDAAGRLLFVPLASAATLFDATGVTRVDLTARPGVSADELSRQIEAAIKTEPYLLQKTADTADSLRAQTADYRGTLLLVVAVVLFAGAFLIFNTLSMTVTERAREVGLLRAAGTSRSQVMSFVLLQALVLGAVGSGVGVVAGVGLAALTLAWVSATGPVALSAPDIAPGSVALALLVGVVVTLAASLEPAWRAGRIPPIEALRRGPKGAVAGEARLRWLGLVFGVLALAAVVVWPRAAESSSASTSGGVAGTSGVGGPLMVYALLLFAVLLVPRVLGPLLRLTGIPFRVFRNEERLARSALARDSSRTALTAGAMVIGLAMVVALGAAALNVRQIGAHWLAETIPGTEVLTSIRPVSPTGAVRDQIAAIPGVKSVSPVGLFGVGLGNVRQEAAAIVGRDFASDGRLVFVTNGGDPASAFAALDAGGTVIVPESLATASNIRLGDTLDFTSGQTSTRLRVVGIVAHSIPGDSEEAILVGWSDAVGPFGATGADFFAVRYAAGQEAAARNLVDATALQYALQPENLDRVTGTVGDALDRVFKLLDALALIAVLIAGLGMVNTLSMSVFERAREIGVLRATGMSSRQVWAMVVIEAGSLGVAGALIGTLVGLFVGGLLVALSSGGFDVGFSPPWDSIALAAFFGVVISVTAAVYPAGIASRQSIVQALQHE
jgi:putative ABC transport system permease protein